MTELAPDPDLPEIRGDGDPRPIDWLATCLARIERGNDRLRAVIALDREGASAAARESAARWRSNAPLSEIDGAPVLVKANYAVAGMPWHAGIAAYRDRIARDDAPAVARLRAAGAVILGLTNMDEGALGATGDNHWWGRIGNPHRPGASAGGSSGGSAAAVAAGYCMAALGTDTIGSIAIPAAYCGVVGHRANVGLLPTAGIVHLSVMVDRAGWHSRSVSDAMSIARALGLAQASDTPSRVAMLALDPATVSSAIAASADLVGERIRRNGGHLDMLSPSMPLDQISRRLFEVAEAEAAIEHQAMLNERPDGFSPAFQRLIVWGSGPGAQRREGHLAALRQAAASLRSALAGYDACLMPAVPHPAFPSGSPPPADQAVFAAIPACLGWPATTVPVGGEGAAWLVTAPSDDQCFAIASRIAGDTP